MQRGLLALAILLAFSLSLAGGCTKKSKTKADSRPAGAAQTEEARLKAVEHLLAMIPADSPSVMALLNWEHLLRLTDDLRGVLGHTPQGRKLSDKVQAFSASAPIPLPISRKEMEKLGISSQLPMAVFGGASPVAVFSLREQKVFQQSVAAAYGKGVWKDATVDGVNLRHLTGARELFCVPRDRLFICSPDAAAVIKVSKERPSRSVWSVLGPWKQQLVTASALVGFNHPGRLQGLALVQQELDGLNVDLRLAGPVLAPAAAVLGGKGAGTLLPLAGDAPTALYLRTRVDGVLNALRAILPDFNKLKLDPISLQSGLTGEALLRETAGRKVAFLLGCRDFKISQAVVDAVAGVLKEAIKTRAAAGKPVPVALALSREDKKKKSRQYTISVNSTAGSFPVKVDLTLAAGHLGIMLGTPKAVEALERTPAPKKMQRGAVPLLMGRFPLADPFAALGVLAEGLFRTAGLPDELTAHLSLARFLAEQMHGLTVTLSSQRAGGLVLGLRARTLHLQGDADADAARDLWIKMLLARGANEGDKATALRLELLKKYPKTRFGKRAADPSPGLLGALTTGILTSTALPAYRQYTTRTKQVEARTYLARMAMAGRFSFKSPGVGPDGKPLPRRFPKTVDWTPAKSCCASSSGQCQPQAEPWNHPTWRALRFALKEPHRFQYRFVNKGLVGKSHVFEAQARGDIGCSGRRTTFTLRGVTDAEGNVSILPVKPTTAATSDKETR